MPCGITPEICGHNGFQAHGTSRMQVSCSVPQILADLSETFSFFLKCFSQQRIRKCPTIPTPEAIKLTQAQETSRNFLAETYCTPQAKMYAKKHSCPTLRERTFCLSIEKERKKERERERASLYIHARWNCTKATKCLLLHSPFWGFLWKTAFSSIKYHFVSLLYCCGSHLSHFLSKVTNTFPTTGSNPTPDRFASWYDFCIVAGFFGAFHLHGAPLPSTTTTAAAATIIATKKQTPFSRFMFWRRVNKHVCT